VREYADGRPHYCWLPLAGRAEAGAMGGEVHLRLQWREDEREADAEATARFSLEVERRIGIRQGYLRRGSRAIEASGHAHCSLEVSSELVPEEYRSQTTTFYDLQWPFAFHAIQYSLGSLLCQIHRTTEPFGRWTCAALAPPSFAVVARSSVQSAVHFFCSMD